MWPLSKRAFGEMLGIGAPIWAVTSQWTILKLSSVPCGVADTLQKHLVGGNFGGTSFGVDLNSPKNQ